MALRPFTDSRGIVWEVWEVEPSSAERRIATRDRRKAPRPGPDRRRPGGADRPRVRISSGLAYGWLAFQSVREKRRLAPAPEGWDRLDDAGLERLLEQAVLSGGRRRLIE